MWCAVLCRLLEHGAKDSSELQMLVAPMSDEELLQVGISGQTGARAVDLWDCQHMHV
jgi:hypothetical protein